MKKILIVVVIVFINVFGANAQDTKIKYGVHIGPNYSSLRGYEIPISPYWYSESSGFSFLGGLDFEYSLNAKLSLKTELNFEQKVLKGNNRIELSDINGYQKNISFTTKEKFNYLTLPILLKYNFQEKSSFYVNGGFFIGYLLNAKLTNDIDPSIMKTEDTDTSDFYKKIDSGLVLGIGKSFDIGTNKSISVEIRDNLGLSRINKQPVWESGYKKTNSLNLILGFSFN